MMGMARSGWEGDEAARSARDAGRDARERRATERADLASLLDRRPAPATQAQAERRRHAAPGADGAAATPRHGDPSPVSHGAPATPATTPPAPSASPASRRRVEALDGLRALAILSVVAYHLELAWLPSGHMGVVMFLVLSGYLVTCSVVRGFERSCARRLQGPPRFGAGLGAFWWRRFKRIWPAMAAMVVLVTLLCIAFDHVLLTKMRPDIVPALLGFENLAYIVRGTSYFDQIGAPSPLTHLWYVGLDVQLCIVWPLVLSALLWLERRWGRGGGRAAGGAGGRGMRPAHAHAHAGAGGGGRGAGHAATPGSSHAALGTAHAGIRCVCLVLAAASAILMGVLYDPAGDPSRVYYGPDTRAFSVLLGAWLGLLWPVGELPQAGRGLLLRLGARGVTAVAGLALVGLVVIMVAVPVDAPFFYYGGMLVVSVLTLLLMMALLSPANPIERLFSLRPLRWLGARSYALYLWHYPIIDLLGAAGASAWWLKLVAVVLSIAAAEATYLLVERPVADGRVAAGMAQLAGWLRPNRPSRSLGAHGSARTSSHAAVAGRPAAGALAAGGCAVLACAAALVGCLVVPEVVLVPKEALVSTGEAAGRGMDLTGGRPSGPTDATDPAATPGAASDPDVAPAPDASSDPGASSDPDAAPAPDTPAILDPAAPAPAPDAAPALPDGLFSLVAAESETAAGLYDPLLVGDSVPGDTNFYDVFVGGLIDSYVGRNPNQAADVLQDYADQGIVGRVVVLAAFSNTTPMPETLDRMVATAGPDRQVYLVGTVNPEGFQDAANQNLLDCAGRYDNVHYVDWPATCAGNEGVYLYPDGTHLTPEGAPVYLDMIARAIAGDVVAAGGTVVPWE